MERPTRRGFIAGAGTALGGALAGCAGSGGSSGGDDGLEAQASFFVFGDLAKAVAGETADAETLVPVGQHGHGWEPGPDLQATVFESDLFVYGMDEFQPWADDVVRNIRADGLEVEPVAVGDGVDLLEYGEYHHDEAAHRDEIDSHHTEEGYHATDDHHTEGGHHAADEHSHTEDGHQDTADEHHHVEGDGAPETEHHHEQEQDAADHDHGRLDPHFWLDPLRLVDALETVREAFVEADGANADAYRANAEAYREDLIDLHEDIATLIEEGSDATVLVAGHGAFGYLTARYGIRIESLTGLSPDATPTPRDVERAQQLIAEEGIDYVVADPLESQRAAEQLVADTDASEVLPLTAIPGRSEQWSENGWGYVEIMREVNLPTLETISDQS
jgi:zinc transport system substrate-binding protein